ncbi:helix-turn-helix domain-containing protein [Pseudomonas luteola]
MKSADHEDILKLLAKQDSPMTIPEIAAETGLPSPRITKVLYELQNSSPALIERVAIEEGVFGYKCIADQITLESVLSDSVESNVDNTNFAQAPAQASAIVHSQVSTQPNELPSVDDGASETIGYDVGSNVASDAVLQMLLNEPANGSDLLASIGISGDQVAAALANLEASGFIQGVEMDDDRYYRISEALDDEDILDLRNALGDEPIAPKSNSQAIDNNTSTSTPAVSRIRALTPAVDNTAAPQAQSAAQVSSPSPATPVGVQDGDGDSDAVGKVAVREAKQRKQAIDAIHRILAGGQVSKNDVFDEVVALYTVRGLKELMASMIASGEILEIRDGRNKYLALGDKGSASDRVAAGAPVRSSAPAPAPAPTPAPRSAPTTKAEPAPVREPITREPLRSGSVAARPVENNSQNAPEARAEVATATAAHIDGSSKQAASAQSQRSGVDIAGIIRALNNGTEIESLSALLMEVANQVRDLETENRVYKEIFGKLGLHKVG